MKQLMDQHSSLVGRRVNISVADGSRIDDCQLVSTGCNRTRSVWVFKDGLDVFIPFETITDVWECCSAYCRAAS
jgi:hypothetical protein